MNANDTITWLKEQAKRVPEEVHKRGMIQAASMIERLVNNLKTAVAQRNEYQEKYWAERERNAAMAAELKKSFGCGACKHCDVEWDQEPCDSCRQDPNFPGWEWKGRAENG